MMKSAFINTPGGVDVLQYGEQPLPPQPSANQVLVKVSFTSVNFIDVYHRTGLYTLPYPAILGRDGVGTVVSVGDGVTYTTPGARVAFVFPTTGSYAEYVLVNTNNVVEIPPGLDEKVVCTLMLQGLTSHYLVCSTRPGQVAGDWVLIHSGAGGCGTLSIQIAKARGLRVITTVSKEEKRAIALECGADIVINSTTEDLHAKVLELTAGQGVQLVLDGVGAATYEVSMKCAAKRGTVVFFGNASGPIPPINPLELTKHGSIFITRPTLGDYLQSHDELLMRAGDLFDLLNNGKLKTFIDQIYPLDRIQQAHERIESRASVGKILINVGGGSEGNNE